MNSEVIKAMNRKNEETAIKKFRKWWCRNGYKILRVIFFPLWFVSLGLDKYNAWRNAQNTWSNERTNEILSYYIPRDCSWNEDDKSFYFFDNGYGWSMAFAKKILKWKDRRYWKVNSGWAGGQIRQYLIKNFELEGFEKEVLNCCDGWTEISFKMIEKEG